MAIKYLAGDRLQGTAAERAGMSEATPTWTANFAVGSPMSNGWSVANSGTQFALDSGNNELDIQSTRGTNYALSFDLQNSAALNGSNAHATAWVLRIVLDIDTITSSVTNSNSWAFGLSSTNSSTTVEGTQDWMGIGINHSTETGAGAPFYLENDIFGIWSNNASWTQNKWEFGYTGSSGGGDILATGTWYIEIKRLSDTSASYRCTTSSNFTGGYEHTFTDLANVDNLRYFKIGNGGGSSIVNNTVGSITSLKLYNGVTSAVNINLPNGAIFEESDTGKHYMFDGTATWNEIT